MGPQTGKETWDGLLEDISSTVRLPVLDVPGAGRLRADTHDPLDDTTLPSIPVLAETAVDQRAALDAQVSGLERQVGELSRKLERLSRAVAERDAALDDLRLEHSELEAELERARFLAEDLDGSRREAEVRAATAEARAAAADARAAERESDLRAAEEQIHRLESELRARAQRPEPPPQPETPPLQAAAALEPAPAPAATQDGVARYLVLTDGDAEIVHMLGRRTTIGRGPDNDLRIDTKYISRHHAVVMVGPAQTLLEDLRSTNGVMVNGRRVTRSALRDGDVVHIGKTQFRYVQRVRDRG